MVTVKNGEFYRIGLKYYFEKFNYLHHLLC